MNNIAAARRGRPKSDEKRQAIRDAAARLFLDVGWGGTSMDAIAQEAGVSKQTVYSHFNSKEDLFRACVTEKLTMYRLDSTDLGGQKLVDALSAYGHRFLDLLNDPDVIRMYRLLISHSAEFPRLIEAFHIAGPERAFSAVASLLQSGAPDRFNDAEARGVAEHFLCMLESRFVMDLLMNRRTEITPEEMTGHVDQCVTHVLT